MKLFIMEKVNIIYIMYSCEDLEDDSLFVLWLYNIMNN